MYLSSVKIKNYRCFEDISIELTPGLNILIGSNNSGKTTLFKALDVVFNRANSKKITIDDFYKGIKSFEDPPVIEISVTLKGDESDTPDDKAIVAPCLIKIDEPWEASLTYQCYLPEKFLNDYKSSFNSSETLDVNYCWEVLSEFIPKYKSIIYGGNISSRNKVDSDVLSAIDCTMLDAIRDVEGKMFSGKNLLLREVIEYFLDYDLKCTQLSSEQKQVLFKKRSNCYEQKSKPLLDCLKARIDMERIKTFAEKTGANKGGSPDFSYSLSERQAIEALTLIIKCMGFDIPVTSNGLGYNNLIYIALLLSKIEMDTLKEYHGDNSILFPLLIVEEPEAHLHPAMQYKLLKFLAEEVKERRKQIIISTHSTHITSAAKLDDIIVLSKDETGKCNAFYPSKCFSDTKDDIESKHYIERYLDATKSNMLFSKAVILVEGIAELMIIPCLAEYLGKPLEDYHISIVRVDGVTFKHFIKLYGSGINGENQKYALNSRVACIVDRDPTKKDRDKEDSRWVKRWPFDYKDGKYEYKNTSDIIKNLNNRLSENVIIKYEDTDKSKTFEYELAYYNPMCKLLLTKNLTQKYSKVIAHLMKLLNDTETDFSHKDEIPAIKDLLDTCEWDDIDKRKSKIAAHYLEAVSKGENAFELLLSLKENLSKSTPEKVDINVPKYIKDAINWVCFEE